MTGQQRSAVDALISRGYSIGEAISQVMNATPEPSVTYSTDAATGRILVNGR